MRMLAATDWTQRRWILQADQLSLQNTAGMINHHYHCEDHPPPPHHHHHHHHQYHYHPQMWVPESIPV